MPEVTKAVSLGLEAVFWALVALALFSRGRLRLCAYLGLIHLSIVSSSSDPTNVVGIADSVKIFVLPLLLLRTEGRVLIPSGAWRTAGYLWIVLTVYAAIATAWSPYTVAGLKMVAFLASDAILFLYFCRKWQDGTLNRQVVLASVWIGLGLAVFQSYVLSNPFGSLEAGFAPRFTSFTSPQSFALFLLVHIGLLFSFRKMDTPFWITTIAGGIGILLTGSRFVFLGLCFLLLTAFISRANRYSKQFRIRRIVSFQSVFAACSLLLLVQMARAFPRNRLQELIGSSGEVEMDYQDVVNVGVRLAIYTDAEERIRRFSVANLLCGEGTSSAANVKMDVLTEYDAADVDANRSMHNEFLRAFYEWGITGFLLLMSVCVVVTRRCVKVGFSLPRHAFVPCVGLLAGIWLSLVVENFLSDPGGPGGTAIALFLAFAAMGDGFLSSQLGCRRAVTDD